MANAPPRFGRLAILAGGGDLPAMIAAKAAAAGTLVHVVAIEGAAEPALTAAYPHTWVNLGQAHRMISALRGPADGPTPNAMIIAGAVRRPDLLKLRPDRGTLPLLADLLRLITAGGDDALLTRAIGLFEQKGLTVVGLDDVAPDLLLGAGVLGAVVPDATAEADMRQAAALIAAIGDLDVGQAVVIANGQVLAIEGAEGTDRMLARLAERRLTQPPPAGPVGAILLKAPKPGQERRVDLPTIGPRTIAAAIPAGVRGIAVTAGSSVGLQPEIMRRDADAAGLFLVGRPADPSGQPLRVSSQAAAQRTVIGLAKRRPSSADMADVLRGAEVVARLASFGAGEAAVVTRGHVLAVAANEPVDDTMARAAALSQWGLGRLLSRRGVIVLRADALTPSVVSAVAASRCAGLALLTDSVAPVDSVGDLVARADTLGLFLVQVVGLTVSPSRL